MSKKSRIKPVAFDDVEFLFMTTLARGYYRLAGESAKKNLIGFIPTADGALQPKHTQHIKPGPERFACHFTIGVNMALSLEIYLKAINLALDNKLEQEHNLLEIYEKLPEYAKTELNNIYRKLKLNFSQMDISEAMSHSDQNSPTIKQPKTFREVVEYASYMFVHWRYIYENKIKEKYFDEACYLHYRIMKRACIAARKFIRMRRVKLMEIIKDDSTGGQGLYSMRTYRINKLTFTGLDSTDTQRLFFY